MGRDVQRTTASSVSDGFRQVCGSLELRVGEETHLLGEGDTFSYSPRDSHTWRNASETDEAIVIWTALPNPYAA